MMACGTPGPVTCGQKGFEVTHTPSKRNKDHTSISYAGEWDATMEGTFNESWSDPLWHEESGRGRP